MHHNPSLGASSSPAEIDLSDIGALLRRQWLLLVSVPLLFLALALAYLNSATYRYTVYYQVSPAQTDGGTQLGRYAGLASLAGVRLPGGAGDEPQSFQLYLASLTSIETAERLVSDPSLLRRLFAEEWRSGAWREPPSLARSVSAGVKRLLGLPTVPWEAPSATRLQEFLEDELVVEEDKRSPVVTVAIQVADPEAGIALLNELHRTIDEMLQRRSLDRSNAYIDYLEGQLRTAQLAEQRVAITEILLQQEQARMMAQADLAFAAELFSGPNRSRGYTSPKPIVVLAATGAAGLFLALVLAVLRDRAGAGSRYERPRSLANEV